MEIVTVKWVWDFTHSTIGEGDCCFSTAKTSRYGSFRGIRRVDGPIPVRQTNPVSEFQCLFPRCAGRVLMSNINSAIVKDLLEQSEVRSVPWTEHTGSVRTVTHHLLSFHTTYAIPLYERNTVYSFVMSVQSLVMAILKSYLRIDSKKFSRPDPWPGIEQMLARRYSTTPCLFQAHVALVVDEFRLPAPQQR